MENYKRPEVYNENALVLFERYNLSKDDMTALYSDNPETVNRHVATIIDRNDQHDEIDWFEFAEVLKEIEPFLAIPFFEELCRRGEPYEAHVASVYQDIGCYEEASEWYRKGMARGADHEYFGFVEGYIMSESALGNFDNACRLLLELLDSYPKNGVLWWILHDVFSNKYVQLYVQPDIAFGCLMQANKYSPYKGVFECEIRLMKEQRHSLYNRVSHLDMPSVVRQNLQQFIAGEQSSGDTQPQTQTLTLTVGDNLPQAKCCEHLSNMRYDKVPIVFRPGQYAHRGGIIDVFPYRDSVPYRIDWFDDNIETIRTFDPKSMQTTAMQNKVVISAEVQEPKVQPQKEQPTGKRRTKTRKHTRAVLPREQTESMSGRYYRIIIYALALLVAFLCYKLYTQG